MVKINFKVRISKKKQTTLKYISKWLFFSLALKGDITLNIVPSTEFSYLGICHDDKSASIKSSYFLSDMINTLAHELKHMQQFQNKVTISEVEAFYYGNRMEKLFCF